MRPSGMATGSNSLTLLTEMLWMPLPSAFITCSVSTPELKHGTRARGRVEVNAIRPSAR